MTKYKDPPSYEEFKKWIKKQGIKTGDEFRKFYRTKLPPNYPKDPQAFFTARGTWKGWGDVVGKEPYRLVNPPSYTEFKKWVRKQGIKSQDEFIKFDRTKFPPGYPKNPRDHYKNKGWKGWNDLCGTEQYFLKDPPSYEVFQKWVQKQGIMYKNEFAKFDRTKFPPGYPKNPSRLYKKQRTWKGWGDLFGTGNIGPRDKTYRSFKKAREFVHKLKLKTRPELQKYCESGKLPKDIPKHPEDTYKNKGWKGVGDWLGSGTIATRVKSANYLTAPEMIKLVEKLGKKYQIKNKLQWEEFAKTHKELLDSLKIPIHIMQVYSKEKVWSRMKK